MQGEDIIGDESRTHMPLNDEDNGGDDHVQQTSEYSAVSQDDNLYGGNGTNVEEYGASYGDNDVAGRFGDEQHYNQGVDDERQYNDTEYVTNSIPAGDESMMSGSTTDPGSPQLQGMSAPTSSVAVNKSRSAFPAFDPSTPGRIVETGHEHTGRWTREEHLAFLSGLKMYGKEWKKVAAKVKTRTVVQTRTHAQKYFQKLQKSSKGSAGRAGMDGVSDDMDDEFFGDIDVGTLSSDTKKSATTSALHAAANETGNATTTGTATSVGKQQNKLKNQRPAALPVPADLSTPPLPMPGSLQKASRRTSTATLSAAQVISTLSSSAVNTGPFSATSTASITGLGSFPPPSRHGFSTTDNITTSISTNGEVNWPSATASANPPATVPSSFLSSINRPLMKIVAPDPAATMAHGSFPEPSPAATGKRKLDEIAAARMLAGVLGVAAKPPQPQQDVYSSASVMRPPPRQPQTNVDVGVDEMDDGPPTPPLSGPLNPPTSFNMTNAPVLPFMGTGNTTGSFGPSAAGKTIVTTNANNRKGGMTLQIVNPEVFGVTYDQKRKRGGENSPVTPWDGQLEALEEMIHDKSQGFEDSTNGDGDSKGKSDEQGSGKQQNSNPASSKDNRVVIHPVCDPSASHGRSELHKAICEENVDTVRILVTTTNNNLSRRDDLGYFPIHSACALRMKSPQISESSDSENDNADDSNNVGDEAETRSIPLEILRLLLEAGADPNETDSNGNTPLHWGSRAGDDAVVRQLLAQEVTVDPRNKNGDSPLHWAMRTGIRAKDAVSTLIQNGAEVSLLDKNFRRAVDVTCEGFTDEQHSITTLRAKERRQHPPSQRKMSRELKNALKAVAKKKSQMRAHFFQLSAQSRTLVLHHPECLEHIAKSASDWEAPDRVEVIMKRLLTPKDTHGDTATSDESTSSVFPHEVKLSTDFDRANLDLLSRVHSNEYLSFVNKLSKDLEKRVKSAASKRDNDGGDAKTPLPSVVPFTPMVQRSMIKIDESSIKLGVNSDTSFSAGSLRAARRAAGAVQHAVDSVLVGRNRNAFCVVRPPGHHAGINGLLDGGESCGFCIFNNVAAGALYAIQEERLLCDRCAIVDIDVHHGNGTEEIIRRCQDPSKLFFFSIHLYDNEKKKRINPNQFAYKFYPGTGFEDDLALNIINVPIVPLWKDVPVPVTKTHNTRNKTRSADAAAPDDSSDTGSLANARTNNDATSDNGSSSNRTPASPVGTASATSGRLAYREAIRNRLLPALRAFNPDLILISAGFDALKGDVGNSRHEGIGKEKMGLDLEPEDYAWTTRKILEIADICCQGRVVSVLEGGYGRTPIQKNNKGTPTGEDEFPKLDRSVFAEGAVRHLQALIDPYDSEDRLTSI